MNTKKMSSLVVMVLIMTTLFFGFAKNIFAEEQFSVSLLKYEPVPVEPGKSFYAWFNIENNLNERVDNINVRFVDYFPFALQADEERTKIISSLASGSSAVVKFLVFADPDATQGTNELKVQYSTDGTNWIERANEVIVEPHIAIVGIDSVEIKPATVLPGDDIEIGLNLTNLAESRVKDISVSLGLIQTISQSGVSTTIELPFTPKDSSAKKTIKDLLPKSSIITTFGLKVDPDAEIKAYKIPVYINYSDMSGEQYSVTDIIGVNVEDKTSIMTILESSNKISPSENSAIDIKLVNKGFGTIKYMTVEIIKTSDFELLGSKSYYLGNVESDDYENVEFNIKPNKKTGSITIPLIIKYTDSMNNEFSLDEEIELSIMTAEELKAQNGSGGFWPFLIIGLLLVGGFFYFRHKKRRN